MNSRRKIFAWISTAALFGMLGFFSSGCAGTKYLYVPDEQMLVVKSHNYFLGIGPCGMPWNYFDQINILFPTNVYRCDASRLEAYQDGKLKIDSGYVILDRTNKIVTIELTFEGYGKAAESVPIKCRYNGVHKYVEQELQEDDITRKSLEDRQPGDLEMYSPK